LERSAGLSAVDKTRSRKRALLIHVALLTPLMAPLALGWVSRMRKSHEAPVQDAFETAQWPICDYLAKHTKPTDPLLIWGIDAAPYVACNRFPASRYVTPRPVAGFIPWIDEHAEVESFRAIPGSRQTLVGEIRAQL